MSENPEKVASFLALFQEVIGEDLNPILERVQELSNPLLAVLSEKRIGAVEGTIALFFLVNLSSLRTEDPKAVTFLIDSVGSLLAEGMPLDKEAEEELDAMDLLQGVFQEGLHRLGHKVQHAAKIVSEFLTERSVSALEGVVLLSFLAHLSLRRMRARRSAELIIQSFAAILAESTMRDNVGSKTIH